MSEKPEIQTQNPASLDDLSPGMAVRGLVKRIELYGAFVDIGVGSDGLLHISQLGRPNVRNVEDVVKTGDQITVYVLRVDKAARKIALSMDKPPSVDMAALKVGETVTGTVTKIENFGVFVDIGAERSAMIHVSELANGYVKNPADVVRLGDQVTAQIISVDVRKRRIDLSIKALEQQEERTQLRESQQAVQDEVESDEPVPTAMALALQAAMKDNGKTSGKRRDDRAKKDRREREQQDLEAIFERTLKNNR
jgi:ribosomal protein S1